MAAEDIHSSSISNPASLGNKDSNNQTQTFVDSPANSAAESAALAQQTLPSNQRDDGTVNWFGSSYTGSDIKVVAHLYTPIEVDSELERLQGWINTYRDVQSGANNLAATIQAQSNDLDFFFLDDFDRNDVAEATGVEDQRAIAELVGAFFAVNRSGDPILAKNRLINTFTAIGEAAGSLAEAQEAKLANRKEILSTSTSTLTLATLQTLSIQTHREKEAVRALGTSYVKGYCRGPRTIAGSMVFTVFDQHALTALIRSMSGNARQYGELDAEISTLLADQLPPIDLTIVFANEYGALSQMNIYGVEFVNDGMTLSIEDLLTEEVFQFVARDADIMTSHGNIRLSRLQRGMHFNEDGTQDETATSLLISSKDAYAQYLDKLRIRRRLLNR